MLKADFTLHQLQFKQPSGTSRGILKSKPTWILRIWDSKNPHQFGIGECSPIEGLSTDPIDQIDSKLSDLCNDINNHQLVDLSSFPCIKFGLETALLDLNNGSKRIICNTAFSNGIKSIKINGLVWMSDKESMANSISQKIKDGFDCIKLKIGAIHFNDEIDLISTIRKQFSSDQLEIRVDANGAFKPKDALSKIEKLAKFDIHSIEQPIQPKLHKEMKEICSKSEIHVALDEELIHTPITEANDVIEFIRPKYIILKPSLIGGIQHTKKWISCAKKYNLGWWMTSALESNIGLNAIAQLTSQFYNNLPQGLGTGQIYTNNIPSFLELNKDKLSINHDLKWDYSSLFS